MIWLVAGINGSGKSTFASAGTRIDYALANLAAGDRHTGSRL